MLREEPTLWPAGAVPDHGFQAEAERAKVLGAFDFDALQDDEQLTQTAAFVAHLCNTPVAFVTIVEQDRQRFLAGFGSDLKETPRSTSMCASAMLGEELLVVPDATKDPRFAEFALVTGDPGIRFYAGAPLISEEGAPLGSLCAIGFEPRPEGLTNLQREGLQVLAQAVMRRLSARRQFVDAAILKSKGDKRLYSMVDALPVLGFSADHEGNFDYYSQGWREYTGRENDLTGELLHPEDRDRMGTAWRETFSTTRDLQEEVRLRRHDGEYRWMLARAKPFRGENGEVERWFGTLVDIEDSRQNLERIDLLARELSHRIKNIFAIIGGLISLRARRQPEHAEFAEELNGSIRALGRAHDYVRPRDGRIGNSLQGLLRELTAPYGGEERISIDGVDLDIGSRAATPLAMVFHELATNAAKYGPLSREEGTLSITVSKRDHDHVVVDWRENDVAEDVTIGEGGFGSQLIKMSVENQLQGSFDSRLDDGDLLITIAFPEESVAP